MGLFGGRKKDAAIARAAEAGDFYEQVRQDYADDQEDVRSAHRAWDDASEEAHALGATSSDIVNAMKTFRSEHL